jgi:outer membrane immunogenic protein
MKKTLIALAAIAAFTAPAGAADMAAKAPMRAAPVAYAPSWTGCYVGGGGGYGLWNQENTTFLTAPLTQLTATTTAGGRGYFGTVQAGCDYQVPVGTWNFVVGAFGDYDFASMKGRVSEPFFGAYGTEKLSSQWSVGGRVGWVALPSLLTYFSAGYTEAHFDSVTTFFATPPFAATGAYVPAQTYKGFFIGAGDEYALNFLPGLFWKTEYRFSDLDTRTNNIRVVGTNALTGFQIDSHKFVHTVRSELVYRFNWGGPLVAKY